MERRRYKVCCGADIHKAFLIATILLFDGTKLTKRFGMDLNLTLSDSPGNSVTLFSVKYTIDPIRSNHDEADRIQI